jgi:hypothetical protein
MLLPFLDLAIWLALVVAPLGFMYFQLRQSLPQSGTESIFFWTRSADVSRDDLLPIVLQLGAQRNANTVTALDLHTWPSIWRPARFNVDSWRALSFPFYCLPAWWFAGRGMDALFGRRRLHWPALFSGLFFFLLFGGLLMSLVVMPASERDGLPQWVFWGSGLWMVLFAVFPLAWVRQRVSDRRRRSAAA